MRLDVAGDAKLRGSLHFTRALGSSSGGNCSLVVPGNEASALTLRDSAGGSYIVLDSTSRLTRLHAPLAFAGEPAY